MFCVTGANRHDSVVFEELVDALPAVAGLRGRPRRWPDKLHADKGYDFERCRTHGINVQVARAVEQTCQQIASTWRTCEYLLDPHSAIGVKAALDSALAQRVPVVSLATAHPAKFPEAIRAAGVTRTVALPSHLGDLFERTERMAVLPNELAALQAIIAANLNA